MLIALTITHFGQCGWPPEQVREGYARALDGVTGPLP